MFILIYKYAPNEKSFYINKYLFIKINLLLSISICNDLYLSANVFSFIYINKHLYFHILFLPFSPLSMKSLVLHC